VGLAWEAKDVLAARRKIYYGKILRRSPTLVSLELFPAFYALSGNRGNDEDYLQWSRAGQLSFPGRRIMEVLLKNPPLTTGDLRKLTGYVGSGKRYVFDRAMAELQEMMLVVKYGELYDPKFTFLWGPLHRWLPRGIQQARRIDPDRARREILGRYLEVRWAARDREIRDLLGWAPPAITSTLESLAREGRVIPCQIRGERGVSHAVPGLVGALKKIHGGK
jgi:hypothetical protein